MANAFRRPPIPQVQLRGKSRFLRQYSFSQRVPYFAKRKNLACVTRFSSRKFRLPSGEEPIQSLSNQNWNEPVFVGIKRRNLSWRTRFGGCQFRKLSREGKSKFLRQYSFSQ